MNLQCTILRSNVRRLASKILQYNFIAVNVSDETFFVLKLKIARQPETKFITLFDRLGMSDSYSLMKHVIEAAGGQWSCTNIKGRQRLIPKMGSKCTIHLI